MIEGDGGVAEATVKIPVAIMGEIERDVVKPRGEGRLVAKRGESAVGAQAGILGDLLGVPAIAQESVGGREETRAMARNDLDEGAFVAAVEAHHEGVVVEGFFAGFFRFGASSGGWGGGRSRGAFGE